MELCTHIALGLKAGMVTEIEALALAKAGCPVCDYEHRSAVLVMEAEGGPPLQEEA